MVEDDLTFAQVRAVLDFLLNAHVLAQKEKNEQEATDEDYFEVIHEGVTLRAWVLENGIFIEPKPGEAK